MHTRTTAALLALVLCGFPTLAAAREYCVTCTGPDATYRCIIGGEPSPAARTSRGQLLCITELARSGGHASCSVGRPAAGACQGDVRTVMFPSAAETAAPPTADAQPEMTYPGAEAQAPAAVPPGPQTPSEGPPQTVEELAKKTMETSGQGLKQAGEAVTNTAKSAGNAVGTALKKTWTCLTSFFGDC